MIKQKLPYEITKPKSRERERERSIYRFNKSCLGTLLLVNIGKPTLTTVVTIEVTRHESPGTASRVRTLLPEPLHLAGSVHLVELEHSELHLLVLVLDLLGLGVRLLLPLLRATTETEDEMKRRLLLDVVVGERASVFELLPGENQSLLVGRDPFLVLDLGLDIVDGVGGLDLEGDCFPR